MKDPKSSIRRQPPCANSIRRGLEAQRSQVKLDAVQIDRPPDPPPTTPARLEGDVTADCIRKVISARSRDPSGLPQLSEAFRADSQQRSEFCRRNLASDTPRLLRRHRKRPQNQRSRPQKLAGLRNRRFRNPENTRNGRALGPAPEKSRGEGPARLGYGVPWPLWRSPAAISAFLGRPVASSPSTGPARLGAPYATSALLDYVRRRSAWAWTLLPGSGIRCHQRHQTSSVYPIEPGLLVLGSWRGSVALRIRQAIPLAARC